jgi:hypothetical protein
VQTFTSEAEVQLSREQAWSLLSDISVPHHYVPGLLSTEITTEQVQGIGASRLVYQKPTKALRETVVEWREGQGFKIRIERPNGNPQPPFKNAFFEYSIEERAGAVCLVNSMSYELAEGFIGRLLDKLVVRRAVLSSLEQVTRNQAAWYNSQFADA